MVPLHSWDRDSRAARLPIRVDHSHWVPDRNIRPHGCESLAAKPTEDIATKALSRLDYKEVTNVS